MLRKSNTFTLIDDESDLDLKKLKLLGSGSYGEDSKGNSFALKILNSTASKRSAFKHIRQEIQILQALNHPNIVHFDEAYLLKDGRVFILMEYLEGGNLKEFIQERKELNQGITDHEKHIIVKQIIEAIQYMHDNQIIHRDLKLENILFKEKNNVNEVKIADFGISQKFDDNIGIHSNSQAGGTRSFMPPEIFNGQSYSKSVDIWSCGIILFMLCSNGRHPFINPSESHKEIIEKLKNPSFQFPAETGSLTPDYSNKTSPLRKIIRLSSCHHQEEAQEAPTKDMGATIKLKILQSFMNQGKLKQQYKNSNRSYRFIAKKPTIENKQLSNEELQENFTSLSMDLIRKMCALEPSMRYSIIQILNHPWITRQNPWKIPLTNNELFSSFDKTQQFTKIIIACMMIEQIKLKGEKKPDLFINLSKKNQVKSPDSKQFQIRKCKNKCATTKNRLASMFTPICQTKQIPIFQRNPQKNLSISKLKQVKNNKYFIQQQQNKTAVSFYFQKLLDSNVQSNVNFAKVQLQKYCKRSLCYQ